MKLLSLFDGEGGFPLAGVMNGVEPVAASEIEPYPIAITRSRFPNMKHLGSVTEIDGAKIELVDIVTFGSPCQDMSVAGKRAGLQHEELGDEDSTRSGLFFEAVRIIKEMRKATNGKHPRFAVWENVPGAFSSNGGRDFLSVLQALASVSEPAVSIPEPERDSKTDNIIWFGAGSIVGNGFSIAWRTLDAQYWGVPQRRKRIYLVADFGSERAAEILFEQTCLRGNIAQSEEARERTAEDVVGCADGSIRNVAGINQPDGIGRTFGIVTKGNGEAFLSEEKHATLSCGGGQAGQGYPAILSRADTLDGNIGIKCLNPWDSQSERVYSDSGVHPSVNANSGGGQDRHGVCIAVDGYNQTVSEKAGAIRAGKSDQDHVGCIVHKTLAFNDTQITSPTNGNNPKWNDPCHALAATDRPPIGIISAGFIGSQGSKVGSVGYDRELAATLRAGQETHCVIAFSQNQREEVRELGEVAGSIAAESGTHQQTFIAQPVIALQANGIDRADSAGCNGAGWREDQSYTLNTVDRHAVCYQDSIGSLCARDYKGVGSQYVDEQKLVLEQKSYPTITGTLSANAGGLNPPAGNCNETDFCVVDKSASDKRYIVRRLMPIETTRLQGYPDCWHDLAPFDGDVDFWESVRKTWAEVNGKQYKPFKSVEKLEKWYNNLRNDASEYKVDGNSLAMPCAEYTIRRIVETVNKESEETT